jgi:hypothetical protein
VMVLGTMSRLRDAVVDRVGFGRGVVIRHSTIVRTFG